MEELVGGLENWHRTWRCYSQWSVDRQPRSDLKDEEVVGDQEEFEPAAGRDWVDMEDRKTAEQDTRACQWHCTLELSRMGAPCWGKTLHCRRRKEKMTRRLRKTRGVAIQQMEPQASLTRLVN